MKANEFWIARDDDGRLFLYDKKPLLYNFDDKQFYKPCRINSCCMLLHKRLFPKVTFENSPQKVRIEIVKE